MAIPVPIKTEPIKELWFNASCGMEQICHLRLINPGAKPMGWRIKTNNASRYRFNPRVGQISAGKDVLVQVTCKPFTFDSANPPAADEIEVEYVTAPEGVQKFDPDWFGGGYVIKKKSWKVLYND